MPRQPRAYRKKSGPARGNGAGFSNCYFRGGRFARPNGTAFVFWVRSCNPGRLLRPLFSSAEPQWGGWYCGDKWCLQYINIAKSDILYTYMCNVLLMGTSVVIDAIFRAPKCREKQKIAIMMLLCDHNKMRGKPARVDAGMLLHINKSHSSAVTLPGHGLVCS